jgi:hypothetical protein
MKNENFCSQLSAYFEITWHLGARGICREEEFQAMLKTAGETETTQENIQIWLELDEGDPGFQLLTAKEIPAVIFFIYFYQHCLYY